MKEAEETGELWLKLKNEIIGVEEGVHYGAVHWVAQRTAPSLIQNVHISAQTFFY
jgi:hypothetical protein